MHAVATLQVVHRRYPDPCVPELLGAGRAVPDAAANVRLLQHLGGGGLGHAGRPREDGLDQGAFRRRVPRHQPPRLRLRLVRRRRVPGQLRLVVKLVRRAGPVPAEREAAAADARRAARVHHLRLLRRRQ